jgi:single-strand DNA-binding protein
MFFTFLTIKFCVMIKLQVIGNLGKDAVVNDVNGRKVINFSVAHTERYKDAQGAQKERTVWVECAYWTDRTAIAPYLKKGTQVYAEGQPDVRTYTTQDGRQGASLSLRIANIQLLGSKSEGGASGGNTASGSYASNTATMDSITDAGADAADDLPF